MKIHFQVNGETPKNASKFLIKLPLTSQKKKRKQIPNDDACDSGSDLEIIESNPEKKLKSNDGSEVAKFDKEKSKKLDKSLENKSGAKGVGNKGVNSPKPMGDANMLEKMLYRKSSENDPEEKSPKNADTELSKSAPEVDEVIDLDEEEGAKNSGGDKEEAKVEADQQSDKSSNEKDEISVENLSECSEKVSKDDESVEAKQEETHKEEISEDIHEDVESSKKSRRTLERKVRSPPVAKEDQNKESESEIKAVSDADEKVANKEEQNENRNSSSFSDSDDSGASKSGSGKDKDSDKDKDSKDSNCHTPRQRKSLPSAGSEKKILEKQKAKEERERKIQEEKLQRQREKDEKERQRKKEKEEKEEQRRKEREEKEEQRRKEREEKEEQRRKEKEEKEEQKRKEKEEKEKKRLAELEMKNEERRKKEEAKEEERRKKEDERRKKELEKEEAENKKKKAAEAFTKFFISAKPVEKSDDRLSVDSDVHPVQTNFMPFRVKDHMKLAPLHRKMLARNEKETLEQILEKDEVESKENLYLGCLKSGKITPGKDTRTLGVEDDSSDEVVIVGKLVCVFFYEL